MSTDPFSFDDPLKKALDDDRVPELSNDFADRVVAAAQVRAEPLPRKRPAQARRWRTGRRLVLGVAAAGALGTAAAATGLLEELGVELPSPQQVWSAVTGQASSPPSELESTPIPPQSPSPESEANITIEGPIDTPEELEEAFRRVDQVRGNRRDGRRERVDERIDAAIERRRQQGLPAPTPEQEERLRERIEGFRERSDERREQRSQERREMLREQLEEDGSLTAEDVIRDLRDNQPVAERLREFRELPPEERRARIREWRERRQDRGERNQGENTSAEGAPVSPSSANSNDEPETPPE